MDPVMNEVALVVYPRLESAGKSDVYRAMLLADGLTRAGDDLAIVFDGGGSAGRADMTSPGRDLDGV